MGVDCLAEGCSGVDCLGVDCLGVNCLGGVCAGSVCLGDCLGDCIGDDCLGELSFLGPKSSSGSGSGFGSGAGLNALYGLNAGWPMPGWIAGSKRSSSPSGMRYGDRGTGDRAGSGISAAGSSRRSAGRGFSVAVCSPPGMALTLSASGMLLRGCDLAGLVCVVVWLWLLKVEYPEDEESDAVW